MMTRAEVTEAVQAALMSVLHGTCYDATAVVSACGLLIKMHALGFSGEALELSEFLASVERRFRDNAAAP